MKMLGSRAGAGEPRADAPPAESRGSEAKAPKKPAGKFDDLEDDIPF